MSKLTKALKDERRARRRERRRNPLVVEKGIDDRHSADIDMMERRHPTVWVRPDVGPHVAQPPPGELREASEESLPVEEARLYG